MRVAAFTLFTLLSLVCPPPRCWAGDNAAPVKLEPGKSILQDGAKLYLPKGTRIESGGKELTTLDVTSLWLVPAKQEKWMYEIRPTGGSYLKVQVSKGAFKGLDRVRPNITFDNDSQPDGFLPEHHLVSAAAGVVWLEQAYEIRDRAGTVLFTAPTRANPAQPAVPMPKEGRLAIHLYSELLTTTLKLPEAQRGITSISLTAVVDQNGEGDGTLVLTSNTVEFNEVGDPIGIGNVAGVGLKCSVKFLKMSRVQVDGGPPGLNRVVEWPIYEIRGEKIKSRLFLAANTKELQYGRLLIHNKAGKVAHVIPLQSPPPIRLEPCHPGCFPAGTLILTPEGTRPVDSLRVGDEVVTIRPDGTSVNGKVQSVFVTRNELVRVETDDGVLLTTPTQPLVRDDGEIRTTEQLQPGEKIFRWRNGKRQAVTVRGVTRTERQDKVFNLVLGNSEVFVAGGFLARSKPPIVAADSLPRTSTVEPAVPASRK